MFLVWEGVGVEGMWLWLSSGTLHVRHFTCGFSLLGNVLYLLKDLRVERSYPKSGFERTFGMTQKYMYNSSNFDFLILNLELKIFA